MKLFDAIFFLRLLMPPVFFLGGAGGKKFEDILSLGGTAINRRVFGDGTSPDQLLTKYVYGKAYDKFTNKDLRNQMQAMAAKASPAPAPAPASGDAVQSARTIMGKMRARQGRASTILSTAPADQGLKTVLGTPLQ